MSFHTAAKNLAARGFTVKTFSTGAEATAYLNAQIDRTSVGVGGSATIDRLGLYDLLCTHNEVYWHWKQEPDPARQAAMTAEVYLCSANALAETGELVNIDGNGNRISSMTYGHKRIYYVIGKNKLTATLEDAIWRARNVAAPKRAQQVGAKTPCAVKGDRCYDCRSPGRVCCAMAVAFAPMNGIHTEVLLIDEAYGL